MRHTNNGGDINGMAAVFPRPYMPPIVLSMLEIAVVIDHVTLNEVKWYDLLWVSTGAEPRVKS